MAEPMTSLTDRVRPYAATAPIAAAAFLGDVPALAQDDGQILVGAPDNTKMLSAHPDGAVLCAARTGGALVTGGDDGRVVRTDAVGTSTELATLGGKWIDAVAARDDGAVAYAAGKQVFARDARGDVKTMSAPSTVRGVAFMPKGYRVALAHYNGASLWFPNTQAPPDTFEWKGSHLDVTASPDGRFLVTSMQENSLHGWRIADKTNMRMSGYPAKSRSLAWSHDGLWLATSGADACIVWPFKEKNGPMGQSPRECGVRRSRVTRVAFHPRALVVAIGYDDGWVLLCRLSDAAELLVRRTEERAGAISALAWDGEGRRLLFGTQDGAAGLLEMPG